MGEVRLFVTRKLAIDPGEVVGDGIAIDVFEAERAPTREELVARARGANGLVTLLADRVDGALLDALGGTVRVVANHLRSFVAGRPIINMRVPSVAHSSKCQR